MTEAPDKESKTEEATEKRVNDSLEKGNFPISRDVMIVALLASTAIYLKFFAPTLILAVTERLANLWDKAGEIQLGNIEDVRILFRHLSAIFFLACGPLLVTTILLGVLANVSQVSFGFYTDKIAPKLSNISLASGMQRLLSLKNFVEFAKSCFKTAGIIAICGLLLYSMLDLMFTSTEAPIERLPILTLEIALRLIFVLILFECAILVFDILHSRLTWRRDLRMTWQEIKEEFRESEGDPIVRSRLRSLANSRARKRMIASIPQATLVIANPTHYAIALRYKSDEDAAPVVVAKGVDSLALKIREIAAEHSIPVIENKILVRAMYEQVAIDQTIPEAFYRAVAEIIILVNNRRRLFQ
jgi:flagellar biosynthetic protein FlhB